MTRLSRRSLLAGVGLTLAAGAAESCGVVGPLLTPYLKKFAEQVVLDKVEDGVTWLAEQGIDMVGKEIFSDGPGFLRTVGLTGDAWQSGSRVLFAAESEELKGKPAAGMVTTAGQQILLLPRAGEALSRTFDALQKGSDQVAAMSAGRAADYLYPTGVIDTEPVIDRSGKYPHFSELQTFLYQAREGTVCVIYGEPAEPGSTPQEYVTLEAFEKPWSYDVAARRTELA